MPPDARQYFEMRYEEGLKLRNIKKELGWSNLRLDAARKQAERVMKRMRVILSEHPLSHAPVGPNKFHYVELLDSAVPPGRSIHVHQHTEIRSKFPDGPPAIDSAGNITWHKH
jgi:hypothetical protein